MTSSWNSCIAFAWDPTMELRVCTMVGYVAQEYHLNVPTISYTLLMPSGGRSRKLSSGVGMFRFTPQLMGVAFVDAFCGFDGVGY